MARSYSGLCKFTFAVSGLLWAAGCGETFVSTTGAGGAGGTGGSAECEPGATRECYTGEEATLNKGSCRAGTQKCVNGLWQGPCEGEIKPAAEDSCTGKDENCNEKVDEGCSCMGAETAPCYTGDVDTRNVGVCKDGVKTCQPNGAFGPCMGDIKPMSETCDGLDNDCNGMKDNDPVDIGTECMLPPMLMNCVGVPICSNLGTPGCKPMFKQDEVELCNNDVDDDCDGIMDPPFGSPYFSDNFSGGGGKWSLTGDWQIGKASATPATVTFGNPDPTDDHTQVPDDGLMAGAVIGGNLPPKSHDFYFMTSKEINLMAAPGPVMLSFWRHLNSEAPPFMRNRVQVSPDGQSWTTVWTNEDDVDPSTGVEVADDQWVRVTYNVTKYKSSHFFIRFGFSVGEKMPFPEVSSWNIDDVQLSSCVPANP